jgi:hypothetical protein
MALSAIMLSAGLIGMLFLGKITEGGLSMKAVPYIWTVFALAALLVVSGAHAQRVIHVDTDAEGANDGSSWANAFVFLQDALAVAEDGDEIWLAEGVYRPDQGSRVSLGDRAASFELRHGVAIFGGFAGHEQNRDDRVCQKDLTTLSGDLLGNDTAQFDPMASSRLDNASTIVRDDKLRAGPASLDCLSISDAHLLGAAEAVASALVMDDPAFPLALSKVSITHNVQQRGFTISIWTNANPTAEILTITDSEIVENVAIEGWQHIFWVRNAPITLDRVLIANNTAGGWILATTAGANVVIKFSDIRSNTAGFSAIWVDKQPVKLTILNSRVIGNRSTSRWESGAMRIIGGRVRIHNCIIAGNVGGESGGGAYVALSTDVDIGSTIFAYNSATGPRSAGGLLFDLNPDGRASISNSIFWRNDGQAARHVLSVGDSNAIAISNIADLPSEAERRAFGGELADLDPLFRDPVGPDGVRGTADDDYRLLPGSPAIDTGSTSSLPTDDYDLDSDGITSEVLPIDLLGHPRIVGGSPTDGAVDIGPFEYDQRFANIEPPVIRTEDAWPFELYPNPIQEKRSGVLRWNAPPANVNLVVIDIYGRRVVSLMRGLVETGQELVLSTDGLSSGLYFVRDTHGHHTRTFLVVR